MGDMTADMASDYDQIKLDGDSLVVTLNDKVNREFCSKPERRVKFEQELAAVIGKNLRIDFLASQRQVAQHQPQPKLTRVQQIRKLEEDPFVAQAMSMFDAEITGFREPRKPK